MSNIQTNLHIRACCYQIQQYSPFIMNAMWLMLVIYVMWLMFNKMADTERSAAVIHTVPDDVPSESRTDETIVSF